MKFHSLLLLFTCSSLLPSLDHAHTYHDHDHGTDSMISMCIKRRRNGDYAPRTLPSWRLEDIRDRGGGLEGEKVPGLQSGYTFGDDCQPILDEDADKEALSSSLASGAERKLCCDPYERPYADECFEGIECCPDTGLWSCSVNDGTMLVCGDTTLPGVYGEACNCPQDDIQVCADGTQVKRDPSNYCDFAPCGDGGDAPEGQGAQEEKDTTTRLCCDPFARPDSMACFEGIACCPNTGEWSCSIGDGRTFPCGDITITENYGEACQCPENDTMLCQDGSEVKRDPLDFCEFAPCSQGGGEQPLPPPPLCCDPKTRPDGMACFEGIACCPNTGEWSCSIGDGRTFLCGDITITENYGKACDCPNDTLICLDGTELERDPLNKCEFPPCKGNVTPLPSPPPIASLCCDPYSKPDCFEGTACCPNTGEWSCSIGDGRSFPCGDIVITEDYGEGCECVEDDVMFCPNGSEVKRDPNNRCEFSPCKPPPPQEQALDCETCPGGYFDGCNKCSCGIREFPICTLAFCSPEEMRPTSCNTGDENPLEPIVPSCDTCPCGYNDGCNDCFCEDGVSSCTERTCLVQGIPSCIKDCQCQDDQDECPDGSIVTRDPENNCQFRPCPQPHKSLDELDCDACPCGYNDGCNNCFCEDGVPSCTEIFCPITGTPSCLEECQCQDDQSECPDGSIVTRDPQNSCQFRRCPELDCKTCPCGFFDGCNNCECKGDSPAPGCTKKFCILLEPAYCSSCPPTECDADVFVCPDGSPVKRDPKSNCEFEFCPTAPMLCSQDVDTCPDGSSVERDPLNGCAFPPCPDANCCDPEERPVANVSPLCSDGPYCCKDCCAWTCGIGDAPCDTVCGDGPN